MLLDSKNNRWAIAFAVLLVIATGLYVPYHLRSLNGPSGGTWPGIVFGIVGFLMLTFVGLLGFRRYVPAWRIGRLETWMRAHIWLGCLGFALILFHSGFHFGGRLTSILMVLLIILTVSGVVGLILQQILPRLMTSQVKLESIYEQIDHVLEQLESEAEERVTAVTGPLDPADGKKKAARPWSGIPESGVHKVKVLADPTEGAPLLKEFYIKQVRPYLSGDEPSSAMANPTRATVLFGNIRTMLPLPVHETLSDLENICEEHRQLRRQQTLHHWLHAWLMIHVPLSYAFLVLSIIHAIYAVSY